MQKEIFEQPRAWPTPSKAWRLSCPSLFGDGALATYSRTSTAC
jgi:hypothetical protein